MKRLWLILLLIGCAPAPAPEWIEGGDGYQYRMVWPERPLPDGTTAIAEYERRGSTNRYGRLLSPAGQPPFFYGLR